MIKTIGAFFLLLSIGLIFVFMNIDFSYPVEKVCKQVNKYKETTGHYPIVLNDLPLNISDVGLFSKLVYRRDDSGFLLYFCPTVLGPCGVCSETGEVTFE